MNILSLPKYFRTRLLHATNCIHKEQIPSTNLAKLLNAQKVEFVRDILFCTTPEMEKEKACEENMRKAECIEVLEKRLPNIFESFVRYSGEFEYSLFGDLWLGESKNSLGYEKFFLGKKPSEFNLPNMDKRIFKFVEQNLSIGMMFLFGTDEDNLKLVVPDEFFKIVEDADRSMAGFHDYCKVFANLYGICNPETIISKWNVNHRDSFLTISKGKSAINECSLFTRYFVSYGLCVCNWSVETSEAMEYIIEGRKQHNPYKPTDSEFVEWQNYVDDINENLDEFKMVRDHFRKNSDNPIVAEMDALCLLDDLRMAFEHPSSIIERYRLQIGFTKIDLDEITPIISAIMELNNKARLWVTYGNSSDSTCVLQNLTTVTKNSAKAGRNDPCPCGSGLKYKKCCGRIVN